MQAGESAALTARQQEAAAAGSKGMMPIGPGGRPFLDYVLSSLADADCRDVCLVVAPDHDAIRAYYEGPGRPQRLRLSYSVQPVADGTARAALAGEAFVGTEPFLVLNSDNLYPVEVLRSLAALPGPGLPAFERDALIHDSGFPAERINGFALLDVGPSAAAAEPYGVLRGIIEKPAAADLAAAGGRALLSMNVWRFDRRIFDACRAVPRSARGEYELPEAVGLAIARGVTFAVVAARGGVLDLSRRSDIALVTGRLAGQDPRP